MKKLAVLFIAVVALVSCSKDEEFVVIENGGEVESQTLNRLNEGVNVKLRKASAIRSEARYGMQPPTYTRNIEVELNNLAYQKEVDVLHQMADGSWKFFPMTYVKSTPDNTEIWKFEFSEFSNPFDNQFVIRYIVNGQEYWDNNNGQNYALGFHDGTLLGDNVHVLNGGGFVNPIKRFNSNNGSIETIGKRFDVNVFVQNYGYEKEVKVVYTTDGWATNNVASLDHNFGGEFSGYGKRIDSPNSFGTEFWTNFSIQLDSSVEQLEYAIVYKVNGQEYWDNNFGQNYQAIIYPN